MRIIHHRINTLSQLLEVPKSDGIELDVRYHENELILHHDPFGHHQNAPEKLETLLQHWEHRGPLILNVKTEGVERACIALMNRYRVQEWFFLDLSMPYFALFAQEAASGSILGFSPSNLAARFSEREALEYALGFSLQARWLWVDCFTRMPLTPETYARIKASGFQICLVSPELQKHSKEWIPSFKRELSGMEIDAVCTKYPELWLNP